MKLPGVFTHLALLLQIEWYILHSLTSVDVTEQSDNMNYKFKITSACS